MYHQVCRLFCLSLHFVQLNSGLFFCISCTALQLPAKFHYFMELIVFSLSFYFTLKITQPCQLGCLLCWLASLSSRWKSLWCLGESSLWRTQINLPCIFFIKICVSVCNSHAADERKNDQSCLVSRASDAENWFHFSPWSEHEVLQVDETWSKSHLLVMRFRECVSAELCVCPWVTVQCCITPHVPLFACLSLSFLWILLALPNVLSHKVGRSVTSLAPGAATLSTRFSLWRWKSELITFICPIKLYPSPSNVWGWSNF